MRITIKKLTKFCGYKDCSNTPTSVVCDNNGKLVCLCDHHAELALGSRRAEYDVICPNCGCEFGVN